MKPKFISVIAGLTMLTCGAATASADVMYTYTGNDFTTVASPYTASDAVTGYIILSQPLGDNLVDVSVTPVAFSFSDGVQTLTNANTFETESFTVFTDATGAITGWLVNLEVSTDPSSIVNIVSKTSNFGTITDQGADGWNNGGGPLNNVGFNEDAAGSWSGPVAVPGPVAGAGIPGLVAAVGIGLFGWRRKRKAQGI